MLANYECWQIMKVAIVEYQLVTLKNGMFVFAYSFSVQCFRTVFGIWLQKVFNKEF